MAGNCLAILGLKNHLIPYEVLFSYYNSSSVQCVYFVSVYYSLEIIMLY